MLRHDRCVHREVLLVKGRRQERVGDLIRQTLAEIVRELTDDPRIGFLTLTGVDVTSDLRHAKVWVSVFDREAEPTLEALRDATGFLRRELGRRASLRHTPELQFHLDASVAGGFRMEQIIERELGHSEPAPDGQPGGADSPTEAADAPHPGQTAESEQGGSDPDEPR